MGEAKSWGFRSGLSMGSTGICYMLLTIVPIYAFVVGDVVFPNLMVSDVIAAGPLYKAMFTFGLCFNTYCVSMAWTDCMRHVKKGSPSLAPAANRFLFLLHGIGCPCLLLLTAFPFDEPSADASTVQNVSELTWFEAVPKDPSALVTWGVHVGAATLFFIGAAGCAAVLGLQLIPHLQSKKLLHEQDLAWMRRMAVMIAASFAFISVFRGLHIVHSRHLWIWPLAVTEVALILFCLTMNMMGTIRTLGDLDRRDPIIDFSMLMNFA